MTQTYHKKWNCVELKQLSGFITTMGVVPRNWYEFEEHYNPIKEWCKENCRSEYQIQMIDDGWYEQTMYIGYAFYFKNRADAVAFKLRWA